jgi:hypothetical protein
MTGSASFAKDISASYLIFSGSSKKLYSLNLVDGVLSEKAEIPKHDDFIAWYENLEKINSSRFLFESSGGWIGVYDLDEMEERKLFERARCPIYFSNINEIVFVRSEKVSSGFERNLYISNLSGGDIKKISILEIYSSKCPIKIDDDSVLYFSFDEEKINSLIFNVRSHEKFSFDIKDCDPVFGIGGGELLCLGEDGYFISDLSGGAIEKINESDLNKHNMLPYAYIPEMHSIIIQEYRERILRNNIYNIWIFDINSMNKRLLVEGFSAQNRGIIYSEMN